MPFTDKELHPSITLGQENNRFPLFFEPQILLREASPPVNGSVPQGQKKLIDCYHLKPSSDYWWMVRMCSHTPRQVHLPWAGTPPGQVHPPGR